MKLKTQPYEKIYLLTDGCLKLVTNILTRWKWSTSKQEQSDISKVVQESSLLTEKYRTFVPKKRTTRFKARGLCPITNKVKRTEQEAKNRVAKNKFHYLNLRAYKCEFCPAWHLTHKKNKLTFH